MAQIATRRSVMTLFSSPTCYRCHRTRIVLSEKGIACEIVYVQDGMLPEDIMDQNPYNSVPTLADRDLILYDSRVINEYLDERFPHPPLMPVDPVSRAKTKIVLYRMDRDWYSLVEKIEAGDNTDQARKQLAEGLAASDEIFGVKPFFLSDEFTLMDAAIAPLLWRLEHYGVKLPSQAKNVMAYADRLFERESFQESMSDAEKEMRIIV